jgi:hypothetical protein
MKCRSCGKEFDPNEDFVEEYEMVEALMYITDEADLCADCSYTLMDAVHEFAAKFKISEEK